MGAQESFLQIAPDGTGKKVRNLTLDLLQPDGTVSTVNVQVVAIADENGQPIGEGNPSPVTDSEACNLLRDIRDLLQALVLAVQE